MTQKSAKSNKTKAQNELIQTWLKLSSIISKLFIESIRYLKNNCYSTNTAQQRKRYTSRTVYKYQIPHELKITDQKDHLLKWCIIVHDWGAVLFFFQHYNKAYAILVHHSVSQTLYFLQSEQTRDHRVQHCARSLLNLTAPSLCWVQRHLTIHKLKTHALILFQISF